LSRSCPVCKSDYRSLDLYSVDDLEERTWFGGGAADTLKHVFTQKLSIKKLEMICFTNVCVWSPEESVLYFSLPVDSTVNPSDIMYLKCPLRVSDGNRKQLMDGRFAFTNKVWDELEHAEEEGEDEDDGNDEIGDRDPASADNYREDHGVEVRDASEIHEIPIDDIVPAGTESAEDNEVVDDDEREEVVRPNIPNSVVGVKAAIQSCIQELCKPSAKLFTMLTEADVEVILRAALIE
jgi:hypothetical protein